MGLRACVSRTPDVVAVVAVDACVCVFERVRAVRTTVVCARCFAWVASARSLSSVMALIPFCFALGFLGRPSSRAPA
jgi:hypothetical protein